MKWFIRGVVLFIVVILGVRAIPVIYVSSGDNVSTTVRYVALGDSIAYGYGLENPEQDSYVGRIKEYLAGKYDYVMLSNFGCNGQRSDELLDILTNPENENYGRYRATLRYADIVTLSIGSNDLLHLINIGWDMDEMLQNNKEDFQHACRGFAKNFPKIISEIRKINSNVEIYANNIYNPAKGLTSYKTVYDIAEYYINWLNQAFSEPVSYHLVDIKTAFDREKKPMINITLKGRQIDPHPSKEGHRRIGEMVIKEMAQ